jgi:uncharacterized protein YndB with AHSA1/START domain
MFSATEDGRYRLVLQRRLAHSPEKVWRALTETEHLRVWFVRILDYDRSELDFASGGPLVFVPKAEHGMPPGAGHVSVYDPPVLLEYTWDGEVLRWELTAEPGGCLLTFTNIVADRGTAEAVAIGWQLGLSDLAALVDGLPGESPGGDVAVGL